MFETSTETDKLDAALAAAQGDIEPAMKDKVNPAFRSKYADLASVWTACRQALAKHKIAVTQWPVHSDDGRLHLVTRLAHGGQWMRAEFSIPVGKHDAHGYGSAMTYAKRYSLAAAIGVVADEDDDGNAAVQSTNTAANAQSLALAGLVKALEANDHWAVLEVARNTDSYRGAFGTLNSKQKAACRELEQRAATIRADYVDALSQCAIEGDEHGAQQLVEEMSQTGKRLVWELLDANTKQFLKQLKKEAA
jgi:hypothetical protein